MPGVLRPWVAGMRPWSLQGWIHGVAQHPWHAAALLTYVEHSSEKAFSAHRRR